MTRLIIAVLIVIVLALALQPAQGAPSQPLRATITPRPAITSVPTWTPDPAYPAPNAQPVRRRDHATATPSRGLQCRSC